MLPGVGCGRFLNCQWRTGNISWLTFSQKTSGLCDFLSDNFVLSEKGRIFANEINSCSFVVAH